jgi:hypothetical protein
VHWNEWTSFPTLTVNTGCVLQHVVNLSK